MTTLIIEFLFLPPLSFNDFYQLTDQIVTKFISTCR